MCFVRPRRAIGRTCWARAPAAPVIARTAGTVRVAALRRCGVAALRRRSRCVAHAASQGWRRVRSVRVGRVWAQLHVQRQRLRRRAARQMQRRRCAVAHRCSFSIHFCARRRHDAGSCGCLFGYDGPNCANCTCSHHGARRRFVLPPPRSGRRLSRVVGCCASSRHVHAGSRLLHVRRQIHGLALRAVSSEADLMPLRNRAGASPPRVRVAGAVL